MSARFAPAGVRIALAAICASILIPQSAHAQASPSPYTTGYRYDLMSRVVGTISPDPDGTGNLKYPAVRNTFDAAGRLIKVESGELAVWKSESVAPSAWGIDFTVYQSTETAYDALDRKLREWAYGTLGGTQTLVQYSYDAVGRLECTAQRMNSAIYTALPASACTLGTAGSFGPDRITRNVYDAAGQLLKVQKAVGVAGLEEDYATYTYSLNGKQLSMTDARGYKAGFTYDGFDRQVAWIFPSKTTTATLASCNIGTITEVLGITGPSGAYVSTDDCEKYSYDRNGNRRKLMKRDGSVIAYDYDNLNRMTLKTVPDNRAPILGTTHTRDISYKYDLRGLMLEAKFISPTVEGITTEYDGFGRILNSTIDMDLVSRTLRYCYDANGNRTRLGYPDSSTTNGNCTLTWTNYVSYTYDGVNRPKTVGGNGLIELKQYVYHPRGTLQEDWTGNMAWGSTLYGRDPIGRLASMYRNLFGTATDYTTTYAYNPASQVTQESRDNDAYAWTAHANADRGYATNGLNEYTQVGASPYCYDPNGNLTADGSFVYLYDVENRLVEKRDQGAGNTNCVSLAYTGTLRTSLRYDPMGRLYETVGPVTGTTRFLIDGDAMVGEYSVVGTTVTMTQRYVHGADGKVDDPIARYADSAMANGNLWFMHADRQGSINAMADTIGNPARLFKYDEYGIPQSGDATALLPANGARFLYTGQAWLPDLGMYYYKARIYSPTLGRFMQTDPIGYDDQVNLYAYVGNDPVNRSDPTGMRDKPCNGDCNRRIQRSRAATAQRQIAENRDQKMQQGASKETGGKVAAGFGETRGVISKLSGATKPFEKLAVGAAPGALKLAGAGLQVQGQIEQGKSPEAAIANVGGQGATSMGAGIIGGAVVGFFGGGPVTSVVGGLASAFGADVSGLSDAGGNMVEKTVTTKVDHPILENGK